MDTPYLVVPLDGYEDVTPIPQDDGPNPVVSIAYPHNCEFVAATCMQVQCLFIIASALRRGRDTG